MAEFDVEIIRTAEPPRKKGEKAPRRPGRIRRFVYGVLKRPRLVALSALLAFVVFIGTPHAGWDYACNYQPRQGQPCRSVDYCAYYGIQGRRVIFPRDGEHCQVLTLLPPDWSRVLGWMSGAGEG